MPVVSICDLSKYDGQEVTVRGWLYNIRSSGKIIFPILRDGSGLLQCIVFKNNVTPEVFEKAKTSDSGVFAGADRVRSGKCQRASRLRVGTNWTLRIW